MFEITTTGIDETIEYLKAVPITTTDKLKAVLEQLMNEGYSIAVQLFSKALYAGTNDVEVDPPYWEGDTLVLTAHGNAVAFIEFGTGINYYDYPDPSVYGKLGMAQHGQYDKHHGSQIRWWYEGEPGTAGRPKRRRDGTYDDRWSTSWGNPPARAMYQASRQLDKERIIAAVKEAFR